MATTDGAGEEMQVLEFGLGDDRYGIDIEYVEQIAGYDDITPVPNSPQRVAGVIDLRGETTTIVDPAPILGLPRTERDTQRVIIFDADALRTGNSIGLLTDRVRRVLRVSTADIEEAPHADADAVEGLLKDEDAEGFMILLDPGVFRTS